MGSAATRYNVAPIINKIVKSINLREDYESVKENRKPIYIWSRFHPMLLEEHFVQDVLKQVGT